MSDRPLSVWAGSDYDLLRWAIPVYWRKEGQPTVLDATYGGGRFWGDTPGEVIGIDVSPRGPAMAMDNRWLAFKDQTIDVLIYDPPHMPERNIGKDYGGLRGLYGDGNYGTDSVVALFPPFLSEAQRVLRPGGVLLSKITDMVHRGRSQWEHIHFITEAERVGLTACDMIIKTRKGPMMDPKWKRVLHARKNHCFWIVCRKGAC